MQWLNTLAIDAETVLVKLDCNAIETNDVFKATTHGWRGGENPAARRDHVAPLLPARSKVVPVVHHPALKWRCAPP